MIVAIRKVPRAALFVAFNIAAVAAITTLVLAPVLSHFGERADDISETATQLARLRSVVAHSSSATLSSSADPFLAGNEERVVSADLQSRLKAIGTSAGVNLVRIRASQASPVAQLHMVAADVDVEGPVAAIRQMVSAIEGQTPLLFITSSSLRSANPGDDGLMHAELKVQGAMRSHRPVAEQTGALTR